MSNPTWQIRPFLPTDQTAAKQLILAGLAEHWGTLDLSLNPDLNDIQTHYLDSGGAFVVAEEAGQLIGTGGLRAETAAAVRIVRVSVAKTHRRLGVGRALTAHLLEIARQLGCTKVLVETTATWEPAIRLYKNFGFAETARRGGNIHMEIRVAGGE